MKHQKMPQMKASLKADEWFKSGERLPYGHSFNLITTVSEGTHCIWNKVVDNHNNDWITMMPGFPDGSFGWSATEQFLQQTVLVNRLYFDYVGMGDSDKPKGYPYGVIERANLIEALWRHHQIRETLLVTFDFSSLVALELLSRQIEMSRVNKIPFTRIRGVLMINGGYFADEHSHPILTTPLLKTRFGRIGTKIAQNSPFAFNLMMKDLWSREYGLTKAELAENHNAIERREGTVIMSDAAGFVDEHQLNAKRWNLRRVFRNTFPDVKYMVAGSEKDQFEPRQFRKAREELEHLGLITEMYPGGHMTTSEYPDLIANSIQRLRTIS